MKIGSLCSGYGGLEMGVQAALGGELAWVSDIDKGACKILAHRYPDVPNLGDMTAVDWAAVEPVDLICGGTPCQDLSHAGKRAGMTEGTRSNLWVAMREAIAVIRPTYVVWENVRGAYSACADSDLGRCPRCLGVPGASRHAPFLRALGRVLGDLSDLGYDASWHGLRASDVGAPHERFRVFVVAQDAERAGRGLPRHSASRETPSGRASALTRGPGGVAALLPTPGVAGGGKKIPEDAEWAGKAAYKADGTKVQVHLDQILRLLPTPAVNDMGEGKTPEEWDAWTAEMKARHGNGNGHGDSLSIEALRLLPTLLGGSKPGNVDNRKSPAYENGGQNFYAIVNENRWGDYAAAIAQWETLTRPAPSPTEPGPKGSPRLSAAFSEWMMGLPNGWVTAVPGITRNEALRALGNGVVPQQATAALVKMASWEAVA